MEAEISKLILELQKALDKKYGRHFKKFYLVRGTEDSDKWEGLINSKNNEERNVEYYSILDKKVVKDEKIFH